MELELIIKIPEKVYEEIMAHYRERPKEIRSADYFERLVLNGTPLPKYHGKLIDTNECSIIAQNCYTTEDMQIIRRFLNNAPAIIEAEERDL